jgi:hypothetical protein
VLPGATIFSIIEYAIPASVDLIFTAGYVLSAYSLFLGVAIRRAVGMP